MQWSLRIWQHREMNRAKQYLFLSRRWEVKCLFWAVMWVWNVLQKWTISRVWLQCYGTCVPNQWVGVESECACHSVVFSFFLSFYSIGLCCDVSTSILFDLKSLLTFTCIHCMLFHIPVSGIYIVSYVIVCHTTLHVLSVEHCFCSVNIGQYVMMCTVYQLTGSWPETHVGIFELLIAQWTEFVTWKFCVQKLQIQNIGHVQKDGPPLLLITVLVLRLSILCLWILIVVW